MRVLIFSTLLLMCVPLASLAQERDVGAHPTVELPPELARVLTDYEDAFEVGGEALVELFAEDGFVLPGGRPPVRGREAIREFYGDGGSPLYLRAIAYATEGSVGYIVGGYSWRPDGPDSGKFTLTLRQGADGRWLIFSDMDNSNRRSR